MPSPKPNPRAAATSLLPRLIALHETLQKQSGPRGLAEAPPPIVRMVRQMLAETRAILPGKARKSSLPRLSSRALPAKVGTGFAVRQRDHKESPTSFAELSLIAGQARASLTAYMQAQGLDQPQQSGPDVTDLRQKLARRVDYLIAEARQGRGVLSASED